MAWITISWCLAAPCAAVDYYVDHAGGSDTNDGLSPASAFASVQHAADLAGPGTVIHIFPGIYRESVVLGHSGVPGAPIIFRGESTNHDVIISGAESSRELSWTRLGSNTISLPGYVPVTNIFMTDLSGWNPSNLPEIIVWEDGTNRTHLPKAREPDWDASMEWKYHQSWWSADGGDSNYLFDATNDPTDSYPGVQSGNLRWINGFTNSFLTGAVLFATDGLEGHYTFRRPIAAHSAVTGSVRVARPVSFDGILPGFDTNTKYFVEGPPQLLDQTGEWCVASATGRLYIWPPGNQDPTNLSLQIARRGVGFDLTDCSHVRLENLVIQDINDLNADYTGPDGAVRLENFGPGVDIVLDGVTIRDCGVGIRLTGDGEAGVISNVVIRNCEVSHCEGLGMITLYWPCDYATNPIGIRCLRVESNEFHHLGFRPRIDMGIGLLFSAPHQLIFQGNHVHHVMQNGLQLEKGNRVDTLVAGNLMEYCCQGAADCAALKVWADGGSTRDMLIMQNVFRHNYGWSWAAERIDWWQTSRGSLAGFGAYSDIVCSDVPGTNAVIFYRNESFDNGNAAFYVNHSHEIGVYNNVCAECPRGIVFDADYDAGMNSSNAAVNNIFFIEGTNTAFYQPDSGITIHSTQAAATNVLLDHNIYRAVGSAADLIHYTNADWEYTVYTNVTDIRAMTPWEDHGLDVDTNTHLVVDPQGHDFNLPLNSPAVDTAACPSCVTALIARLETSLGIVIGDDPVYGDGWDVGAHECVPAPFSLTGALFQADACVLGWTSVFGAAYCVEFRTDLCSGAWTTQAAVNSAGYGTCWTSSPFDGERGFYRISLSGPE